MAKEMAATYVNGDRCDLALDYDGRAGALVDVERLADTFGLDHNFLVVDVVLDGPLLAVQLGADGVVLLGGG